MDMSLFEEKFDQWLGALIKWVTSPEFYSQLGLVILAVVIAWSFSLVLRSRVSVFAEEPTQGSHLYIRSILYHLRKLLFPLFSIIMLQMAAKLSSEWLLRNELVDLAKNLAIIWIIWSAIDRYISDPVIRVLTKWVAIPLVLLQIAGVLSDLVAYLESLRLAIGNIDFSAYAVVRVILFGVVLFWLGRYSNRVGQRIIRQQTRLDVGTREIAAKLFQVTLFVVIFLLLLQIMGVNITALAVFGGALGVGLGFGLQAIASNFISGVILLLDRSLTVGDYIELADGRQGTIRELNMRSTLLETYDGKDIVVPNEQFITASFVNWTHKNQKQRYSINLQVAYSTDLHKLFDILRQVVASHPRVISGDQVPIEERPDAEISGFADSGVNILIEFWMEGIDDGENRVGGDLYLMIWDALRENHIEIPYPQREVRIIGTPAGSDPSKVL